MKNNILITTGIYPPSTGGPATHAEKLFKHFSKKSENNKDNICELFIFEKYNYLPSGIRHIVSFFKIFKLAKNKDIIFALDGFSVALPTILASKILNKKVYLRIGGDFVHENYVEASKMIPLDKFYYDLKNKNIKLNLKLKIKLAVQKFILENADGIIYTTNWQKNIYDNFYNIKSKQIFVFKNPIDLGDTKKLESNDSQKVKDKIFISPTRKLKFKNLDNLQKAFDLAVSEIKGNSENNNIILDTKTSNREDVLSRIKNATAYINVSISDISPNSILESLTLGTPVICTNNTGIYDDIKEVARFVDPLDILDIKNAILEMSDENINNQYREKIKTWHENNRLKSWSDLYLEYDNLIDKVCK